MSCDDIFTAARGANPLEETLERIGGSIKARLVSPGDRLPSERDLAAQLGVSRSTLRVALQHLEQAGWLEVRRGRSGGTFVARWPVMPHPRRLPEILTKHRAGLPALLDYRRAIESTTAAFAAERAAPAEVNALETLSGALAGRAGEFEAYRAGDARFHIGIARATHSPRLLAAVIEIQAAMTEVLDALIYHSVQVLGHSPHYHWHILDAIRARDGEAARRSMLDHIMATENVIYSLAPEIRPLANHERAV